VLLVAVLGVVRINDDARRQGRRCAARHRPRGAPTGRRIGTYERLVS
jgi:hypothetical protein